MQFYVIIATLCAGVFCSTLTLNKIMLVAHGRAFVKRQTSDDPVLPIKPRRHWLYENSNFGRTIQGSNLSPWQFERAQTQPADSFVYWKTLGLSAYAFWNILLSFADNDKTVFDSINEERPHFLDGTYNHRGGNVVCAFRGKWENENGARSGNYVRRVRERREASGRPFGRRQLRQRCCNAAT